MTRYTARDSHGKAYFAGCVREVFEQITGQMDRRSEWIDEIADKLAEYEDAEEAGRLVKLPCALGDTVYAITADNSIVEYDVVGITIEHYRVQVELWSKNIIPMRRWENNEDFGKTVFLTREEAEAALKKGAGE